MNARHNRWLIVMLAALIGGGGLLGCGEDAGWDHPNRERYAAPPPETDDSKSVEDLQREWRRQDRLAEAKRAQAAARHNLQQAREYLQLALEAAVSMVTPPPAEEQQPRAVGGGPTPGREEADADESGEM